MISLKLYRALQIHDNLYLLNKEKEETIDVVLDDGTRQVHCNTLLTRIKHDKRELTKTLKILYEANDQLFTDFLKNKDNKIDLSCVEAIVESLIFLTQHNKHYLRDAMPHLRNDYGFSTHSFNVAVYALHLGNILHFSHAQLVKLGKAALLHDIGTKNLDSIVDKDIQLNMEELELVHKHSLCSVKILEENSINDPFIIDAVKQHHERYDGSGYPNGLLKNEMSDFGSILAICDVFDALTIDRPHRKRYTTFEALKIMIQDEAMKNKFNNDYIKLLLVSISKT